MLQSADEKWLVIVYKGPATSVSLNAAGGVYWLSWAGWALPTVLYEQLQDINWI